MGISAGPIFQRKTIHRVAFNSSFAYTHLTGMEATAKRTLIVTNLEKDSGLGRIGKVAQLGSPKRPSVPKSAGNQQAAIAQQSGRVAVARGV